MNPYFQSSHSSQYVRGDPRGGLHNDFTTLQPQLLGRPAGSLGCCKGVRSWVEPMNWRRECRRWINRTRWTVSVVSRSPSAGRMVATWNETSGSSCDRVVHQIQPWPYRHPDLIGSRCMVSSVVEPDELKAPLRLDVLIGSEPERCRWRLHTTPSIMSSALPVPRQLCR
jgi:hypothetical protein